ncbi:hypothetical protein [Arthrobacter sp. S39]|uniref:DUF6932 family protein n=1 Tax=Arthrobacter sp. S39 TaxID=2509720 RepID=UPI0010378C05|nr:hypothetical protein [Arthrobacter sp. S39]TAP45633.1 hypothetical protein EYS21_02640 [Arthrobacter sp. S39]
MIPALDTTTNFLPLGRYACTLDELKQQYVDDPRFTGSTTRAAIYDDFLAARKMLDAISPDLIEKVWVGGSFVTGLTDPDDLDCTFVISGPAFRALDTNGLRAKVMAFNKKGWVRKKAFLRVETFLLVREPIANPWLKDGLHPDAVAYLSVRGAWDDWWMRVRTNPDKSAAPVLEDAEPKRGYLEVSWK